MRKLFSEPLAQQGQVPPADLTFLDILL